VDGREVPHLERWPYFARRSPRQYLALLVHRRDRLLALAVSRALASAVAVRDGARAGRLRRVSEGDPASAALARGQGLYRHPALDGHAAWRPLRRAGSAAGARARGHRLYLIASLSSSSAG